MKFVRLPLLLGALVVVTLAGLDIGTLLSSRTDFAAGPSPYFIAGDAAFLYLWVPLVVLAASALFLAPGLLLALGAGRRDERFELWLLQGFTLSLFVVPTLTALVQTMTGIVITGAAYVFVLTLLCLPGLLLLAQRGIPPIFTGRGWDVGVIVLLPALTLIVLAPKFFWESLNDDGAHTLLNAMLFVTGGNPFWPPDVTVTAGYPSTSMMSEAFLQTGISRFFGPSEATIRLAYLPGLSVMAACMLSFMRDDEGRTRPEAAIGLTAALLLYSFVMAFNPTYSPYFADIALPLTREPLIVLGFLGYVLFFFDGRLIWMAVVSTLALLSAPNGVLLVGFFLGSHFLLTRPLPFAQVVVGGLIALGVSVLASAAMVALDAAGVTRVGGEFGATSILRRLRFVTLFETDRILFWLLPAGVLPGLALLAWRWQDQLSRTLTLTTVIYVLFFYVQAYRILPHHFAPAALLPLIVFWRLRPVRAAPAPALLAALAGVLVGLWASFPDTTRPFTYTREFAERIVVDYPSADPLDADKMRIVTALLSDAFPPHWTDADLEEWFSIETLATYMHTHTNPADPAAADYRLVPEETVLSPDEILIAGPTEGFVLLARDAASYNRDLRMADLPVSIARALRVPRESTFGRGTRDGPKPVWDLARVVGLR